MSISRRAPRSSSGWCCTTSRGFIDHARNAVAVFARSRRRPRPIGGRTAQPSAVDSSRAVLRRKIGDDIPSPVVRKAFQLGGISSQSEYLPESTPKTPRCQSRIQEASAPTPLGIQQNHIQRRAQGKTQDRPSPAPTTLANTCKTEAHGDQNRYEFRPIAQQHGRYQHAIGNGLVHSSLTVRKTTDANGSSTFGYRGDRLFQNRIAPIKVFPLCHDCNSLGANAPSASSIQFVIGSVRTDPPWGPERISLPAPVAVHPHRRRHRLLLREPHRRR